MAYYIVSAIAIEVLDMHGVDAQDEQDAKEQYRELFRAGKLNPVNFILHGFVVDRVPDQDRRVTSDQTKPHP